MALAGCSLTDLNNSVLRAGWPEGITPEAQRMQHLWTWSIVAAMAMGILVWGLVFWTVLFHRRKKNSPEFPRQTGYNVPLELAYTAFPFLAIAVLFFFTVQTQNFVNENPSDPDVVVDVTAMQWNWQFGYREAPTAGYQNIEDPDAPGKKLNRQFDISPETAEKAERGQTKMREDWSYLYDDQIETVGSTSEIPVLVLPVDQSVRFVLASKDVIHSFWVPEFLFKRDVMPFPKANQSRNEFTISDIDKPGAFVGRCAEMCGTYHSMMNFEVRAIPQDLFSEYLELRDPQRNGGDMNVTNADALARIQQEHPDECMYEGTDVCTPTAITTHPFEQRYNQQAVAAPSAGN